MEASSSHVIRNLPIFMQPGDTTGDTKFTDRLGYTPGLRSRATTPGQITCVLFPAPVPKEVLKLFLRFDELRRGEESTNLRGSSRTVKIMQKNRRFPAAFKVRNDLLTQGYGIDRAKSSTLLSKSTEAESSGDTSPNKKSTSVHSQNSATTEQL